MVRAHYMQNFVENSKKGIQISQSVFMLLSIIPFLVSPFYFSRSSFYLIHVDSVIFK